MPISTISGVPYPTASHIDDVPAENILFINDVDNPALADSWLDYDGTNDGPFLQTSTPTNGINSMFSMCRLSTTQNTFFTVAYETLNGGFSPTLRFYNHNTETDVLSYAGGAAAGFAMTSSPKLTQMPSLFLEDKWVAWINYSNNSGYGIQVQLVEQADATTLTPHAPTTLSGGANGSGKTGFGSPTMFKLEDNKFIIGLLNYSIGQFEVYLMSYDTGTGLTTILDSAGLARGPASAYTMTMDPAGDFIWGTSGESGTASIASHAVGSIRRVGDTLSVDGTGVSVTTDFTSGNRALWSHSLTYWKDDLHVGVATCGLGQQSGYGYLYLVQRAASGNPVIVKSQNINTLYTQIQAGHACSTVTWLEDNLFMLTVSYPGNPVTTGNRYLYRYDETAAEFQEINLIKDAGNWGYVKGSHAYKFEQEGILVAYSGVSTVSLKIVRPGNDVGAKLVYTGYMTAGLASGSGVAIRGFNESSGFAAGSITPTGVPAPAGEWLRVAHVFSPTPLRADFGFYGYGYTDTDDVVYKFKWTGVSDPSWGNSGGLPYERLRSQRTYFSTDPNPPGTYWQYEAGTPQQPIEGDVYRIQVWQKP